MGKQRKAKKQPFNQKKLLRHLLVIFLVSFFISTAMLVYLFGWTDDFFSRLFFCILVIFLLIAITVLGIIPGVNYVMLKWPELKNQSKSKAK